MAKGKEKNASSGEEIRSEELDAESNGARAELEEAADDDSDIELLIALAELDAEAAEAYRLAAEYAEDPAIRSQLEKFRGDHVRHVETLNRLLSEAGGAQVSFELEEGSSSVTMLAAAMGTLGLRAALLAMIANEQLTNSVYQAVTELPFEEEVSRILEGHLADEQRHLQWLTEQDEMAKNAGIEVGADP